MKSTNTDASERDRADSRLIAFALIGLNLLHPFLGSKLAKD